MKRALLLGVVLAALVAGSAEGQTTIVCEAACSRPYQQWVDAAKVPTPDETITVKESDAGCTNVEGHDSTSACTQPSEAVIWFGPRRSGARHAFYHELGHNFDYLTLPEWARFRYLGLTGKSEPWDPPPPVRAAPDELFADSYSLCAVKAHLEPGGLVGGEQPYGGWRVQNQVCGLIRRVGTS